MIIQIAIRSGFYGGYFYWILNRAIPTNKCTTFICQKCEENKGYSLCGMECLMNHIQINIDKILIACYEFSIINELKPKIRPMKMLVFVHMTHLFDLLGIYRTLLDHHKLIRIYFPEFYEQYRTRVWSFSLRCNL